MTSSNARQILLKDLRSHPPGEDYRFAEATRPDPPGVAPQRSAIAEV